MNDALIETPDGRKLAFQFHQGLSTTDEYTYAIIPKIFQFHQGLSLCIVQYKVRGKKTFNSIKDYRFLSMLSSATNDTLSIPSRIIVSPN